MPLGSLQRVALAKRRNLRGRFSGRWAKSSLFGEKRSRGPVGRSVSEKIDVFGGGKVSELVSEETKFSFLRLEL